MGPRLTACLIARDEAAFLPACLASLREVVDEVVLVDTGSTDATPEIARAAGATVATVAWADDFAAARNASLALATGDWVLAIDADEELLPESVAAVRRAIAEAPPELGAFLLPVRNLTGDAAAPSVHVGHLVRLFRNRPDVRWTGRVHEQITESLSAAGLGVAPLEAPLLHKGYLAQQMAARDKLTRNEALLRRRVAEDPGSAHAWYHLGKTLRARKAIGEALEALDRALDLAPVNAPYLADARWERCTLLDLAGRPAQALAEAEAVIGRHMDFPPLLFLTGVLRRDVARDPAGAREALQAARAQAGVASMVGHDASYATWRPLRALAELALREGDAAAAAEALSEAVAASPRPDLAAFAAVAAVAAGKPVPALPEGPLPWERAAETVMGPLLTADAEAAAQRLIDAIGGDRLVAGPAPAGYARGVAKALLASPDPDHQALGNQLVLLP